jgi:hypothetical protein
VEVPAGDRLAEHVEFETLIADLCAQLLAASSGTLNLTRARQERNPTGCRRFGARAVEKEPARWAVLLQRTRWS